VTNYACNLQDLPERYFVRSQLHEVISAPFSQVSGPPRLPMNYQEEAIGTPS
jgi:hypothetical protein